MTLEVDYLNFLEELGIRLSTEEGLPTIENCIAPNHNWDSIIDEFNDNKIVIVDNFLNEDVVNRLRNYALVYNVYSLYYPGYRSIDFECRDYENHPTVLKSLIADCQKKINICEDYNRSWFFIHDYESESVRRHIDDGAKVTINIWLTPTECFYDPKNYNGLMIEKHNKETQTIGYEYNRAVIFDSHQYHYSQGTSVIPSWANQKINYTMLFGFL